MPLPFGIFFYIYYMRAQLNHRPHCGPILTPSWEGEDTLLAKSYFINLYFRNFSIDLKFIQKFWCYMVLNLSKILIPFIWLISDHRRIDTSLNLIFMITKLIQ